MHEFFITILKIYAILLYWNNFNQIEKKGSKLGNKFGINGA